MATFYSIFVQLFFYEMIDKEGENIYDNNTRLRNI